MYYTYMLRCEDNSIYTGMTKNVEHRMEEHFTKIKGAKYTSTHTAKKLEAVWQSENRALASKLEYRIKRLTKAKKEELIQTNNLEELLQEIIDCKPYKRIENIFF
ncbi:MAG: GIY-YIG nuclease family protein [Clostridia bacterium]|nr:GIY-YIG nuclease family protein [Clostridia bacterium]